MFYTSKTWVLDQSKHTHGLSILIMVIELSGVQFGVKSCRGFQNQTSAQRITKIARPKVQLPLYYIHFEITQFNSLNTRTTRTTKVAKFAKKWPFCLSFSCNVID